MTRLPAFIYTVEHVNAEQPTNKPSNSFPMKLPNCFNMVVPASFLPLPSSCLAVWGALQCAWRTSRSHSTGSRQGPSPSAPSCVCSDALIWAKMSKASFQRRERGQTRLPYGWGRVGGGVRTRSQTWQSVRLCTLFFYFTFLVVDFLVQDKCVVTYCCDHVSFVTQILSLRKLNFLKQFFIMKLITFICFNFSLDWFKIQTTFMKFYASIHHFNMLTESFNQGWTNFWTGGWQWVVKIPQSYIVCKDNAVINLLEAVRFSPHSFH